MTSPSDDESQRACDEKRGTAHSRGYGTRWQKYRADFLARHPWCVACLDLPAEALVVDHIVPVLQDGSSVSGDCDPLFYAGFNHEPLCRRHHDVKTRFDDRVAKHRTFALSLIGWLEANDAKEEEARDILLRRSRLWKEWVDLSYAVDGRNRRLPGRALGDR